MAVAMPLIMPPPPTGARMASTLRQIFQDFQADSALTRNNLFFVVVRRHDHVSVLCGEFFGFGLALGTGRTHQYDLRTQGKGCLALD